MILVLSPATLHVIGFRSSASPPGFPPPARPRIKHRLGAETEPALRQFTDREGFLGAFDAAFGTLSADRHSVVTFYGVGGIGKTALLQEIRRRLREEPPEVAHAQLDLRDGESRLPAMALLRLRATLHQSFRVGFPTFDLAFAVYWKLAHPHLPLTRAELPALDEGQIAADLIATLAEIPVIGLGARIPRIVHKAGRATREWWTRRGQIELRNIAALDAPVAVAEWLPAFWAADLKAWLAEATARRKAVLFLDTYEALLTGQRPYALPRGSAGEMEQAIRDQEPLQPSALVTRTASASGENGNPLPPEAVARLRSTDPHQLRAKLHGDLDTIVLRALSKAPQRRYASAEQLAEDIERHLSGWPIRARRDSWGYRARRFLSRHPRGAVVASAGQYPGGSGGAHQVARWP